MGILRKGDKNLGDSSLIFNTQPILLKREFRIRGTNRLQKPVPLKQNRLYPKALVK